MVRLIDADNLVSVLEILCDKTEDIRYWEQLKWIVGDMPTIESVEVVRCKDCIYGEDASGVAEGVLECKRLKMVTKDDWFCAEGKRDETTLQD